MLEHNNTRTYVRALLVRFRAYECESGAPLRRQVCSQLQQIMNSIRTRLHIVSLVFLMLTQVDSRTISSFMYEHERTLTNRLHRVTRDHDAHRSVTKIVGIKFDDK